MAAGYDPKKAETYNKLRQQGVSEDQAWKQAGITEAEEGNYVINDSPYNDDGTKNTNRGQMGAWVVGTGTITTPPTAAERAESDAYYKSLESSNFERVDYPVKANSQPSNKTPTNYVTTSTEEVSGGGSRTITSAQPTANDTSRAIQAQADAKSLELKQYLAENPRNGNYTPAQAAERREKIDSLVAERGKLASQATAAETPGNPTETIVPNTTTKTSTTTYGQTSTNSNVETTAGPDPALNQQPDADAPAQAVAVDIATGNSPYASQRAQQNEQIQAAEPAPVDTPLLTPAESIARAQVTPTEADPASAAADFNANTNASVLGAIGVKEPETVSAATPGTAGAESAFNQGALGTRAPAPQISGLGTNQVAAIEPAAETAAQRAEREAIAAAAAEQAAKQRAQEQAAIQAEFQTPANGDWRVRLRLAPGATYLYKDANNKLLAPLAASDGVVFPYMPSIGTTYTANYDQTDLVHSNYKGYFYRNSAVDAVSITGRFTAQDTFEATYLLAVIHFFKSVTKMFYGQDWQRGAPPPLVFLSGLGEYQFNNHPCVVNSFNYSLPNDVDYIRTKPNNYNVDLSSRESKPISGPFSEILGVVNRLKNAALPKGAVRPAPEQGLVTAQSVNNTQNSTYVPTSIDITITLLPIQTRKQISQGFSVQEFSKGTLLRKGFW
jgi:hypothetical protein